jgi:streptogramin lyase
MSRRLKYLAVAAAATALTLLSTPVAQAAPVGLVKQFRTPTADARPRYIAEGSDGNLWFTENPGGLVHNVARITPAGDVTEFDVCNSCFPDDIAQGPDGILYFTNNDTMLGRITTAGDVLAGVGPGLFVTGNHLAVFGDTVWITDFNADVLWRYDITSGTFTSFAPPTVNSNPGDVAVDANGIVWFTQNNPSPGAIASFDPATNTFVETPLPAGGQPRSVAVATDGTVWFTKSVVDRVGRVDPATRAVTEFPTGVDAEPAEIAASPDGSLWFTQEFAGNIARITTDGVITAETKSVRSSLPLGITVALNGDPWYVDNLGSKVVTVRLR